MTDRFGGYGFFDCCCDMLFDCDMFLLAVDMLVAFDADMFFEALCRPLLFATELAAELREPGQEFGSRAFFR